MDLATSVVPYVALSVLMYLALSVSYLLVLVIAVPAAGFLLRTYMIFHDCAHGSFLPSRRANVPCPEVFDPARTMLGDAQERWLFDGLSHSTARWNVRRPAGPVAD